MGIILLSIDACSNPFLQRNGNEGRNIGPGSGLTDDPFLVRTVDDLLHVGNPEPDTKWAEWDLEKHYKQVAHIDLAGIDNWTPVGTDLSNPSSPNLFIGSYDGGGHKIRNLNPSNEYHLSLGLFSCIGPGGVVKNLGMVDIDISDSNLAGGVAVLNYGTIQDCYVTGSISGFDHVGGVAGRNSGTIQNCYASGRIKGYGFVGGVAGRNYIEGEITPVVQNCYAVCEISADSFYSGGIVGKNEGIVQNCYAAGNVSGKEDLCGGVAGENTGTVRNCVALNKAVTSELDGVSYIGRVTEFSDPEGVKNNYAWEAMIIQSGGVDKDLQYAGPDTEDGLHVAANNIKDKSWWTNSGNWKTDGGAEAWDFTNVWVWSNKNMPRLKNFPVLPWPDYLE